MKHFASRRFWRSFNDLPSKVQVQGRGFTLIELLVTLCILALLLAVIPPRLSSVIESGQVRVAKRELISGLRFARSQAVSSQQDVTLDINVQDNTMTLAAKQRALSLPDSVKLTLVTAQQEQLSEHEGAIRFYPDGSSTGGQIRFRQGKEVSSIDVNWLTGRVSTSED